jgi:hypothetical protein
MLIKHKIKYLKNPPNPKINLRTLHSKGALYMRAVQESSLVEITTLGQKESMVSELCVLCVCVRDFVVVQRSGNAHAVQSTCH